MWEKIVCHKKVILSILAVIILGGCGAVVYYQYSTRIYTVCYAEAGTQITAEDFLKDTTKRAEFVAGNPGISSNVPGTYSVAVKSGIFTYNCTITIQDTVAPAAEPLKVYTDYGVPLEAKDLVTNVQDKTAVTVSYAEEPDFKQYGMQTVPVILTDLGGNTAECEATVIIRSTVEEITVEAGGAAPTLESFLLTDNTQAKLLTPLSGISTDKVADYEIRIDADNMIYTSLLHVVDTIAPVLEVTDISTYTTGSLSVEDFVVSAEDVTTVTYSFDQEPDMSQTGAQDVIIRAVDEGGNITEQEALLILEEDTEAPVIEANDIYVFLGNSVSYKKNAAVTDNCDKDIALSINSNAVNVNVEGTYNVTYTATDRAGNTTSKDINVIVREQTYDTAEINALCDQVLGKILNDSMSQYDKLLAIYTWVRGNVRYINHSNKISWEQGAYEGLALHKGDCFVYAAVSKALLTRAGIRNVDIQKIPSRTQHFWNLVDIGEGWRHFDTCPRSDGSKFFYVTDEDLMAYSNTHKLSHNYDKSVYTYFNQPQTETSQEVSPVTPAP